MPKTGYKSIHSHGHEKPRFIAEATSQTAQKRASPRPLVRRKAARKIPPLGHESSQTVHRERCRTSFRVHLHFRNLPRFLPNILAMRALNTFERPIERFNASPSPRRVKEKSVSIMTNQASLPTLNVARHVDPETAPRDDLLIIL